MRRRSLKPGKVALISGGGSGHEPLHAGYVGLGMLDAACPGQVFTSPTPDQMIEAAEAVDTGAGVLFIVKNYEGDVMNFTMAAEMAAREVASVVTDDDVAVENSTYTTGRRGVAGTLIVEKMVGAAAESGMSLPALKTLGDPVQVKLSAPYKFFFVNSVRITLVAKATMRLEQVPKVQTGGGGPSCT